MSTNKIREFGASFSLIGFVKIREICVFFFTVSAFTFQRFERVPVCSKMNTARNSAAARISSMLICS